MRNGLRVFGFDILAPAAAIAALVVIGIALGWPLWWVSVCSILCLLIAQGVAVNFILARRDKVTVGTDDDGPGLRMVVMAATAAAAVAAVAVCYTSWTRPDATLRSDTTEVVNIASSVAEAFTTFSPQDPMVSAERAAAMMGPERAQEFLAQFTNTAEDLRADGIASQTSTLSAGVEFIGPTDANVAVLLRSSQSMPGEETSEIVLALRIQLVKEAGKWLVFDLIPLTS